MSEIMKCQYFSLSLGLAHLLLNSTTWAQTSARFMAWFVLVIPALDCGGGERGGHFGYNIGGGGGVYTILVIGEWPVSIPGEM